MKEVLYKDMLLQKGSLAYELYFDKDPEARKRLDLHLKEVNQKFYSIYGKG